MCVDDWILVAQQSPMAAGARGFGLGHAFSREGDLVALCLVIIDPVGTNSRSKREGTTKRGSNA